MLLNRAAMGDRQGGLGLKQATASTMHGPCAECSAGCGSQTGRGRSRWAITPPCSLFQRRKAVCSRCWRRPQGKPGAAPGAPKRCHCASHAAAALRSAPSARVGVCMVLHGACPDRGACQGCPCPCGVPWSAALCSACSAAFRGAPARPAPAAAAAAAAVLLLNAPPPPLPSCAGLGRWRAPTRSAAATWRAWRR